MAVLFIVVFAVLLQVAIGHHHHAGNCNDIQCAPEPFNRTCKPVKAAGKCCPYYFCDDVDSSRGCESKRSQPGCLTPPPNKIDCTAFRDPYGCCTVFQCRQDEKAGVCPREAPVSQEEDKRSTWGRLFDSFKKTVNKITRGVKTTLETHGGSVGKVIAQMIPDPFNPENVIAVPLIRCTGDYTCPGTMKCCHPLPSHVVQKRRRKRHGKTWIMIHVFVGRQKRSNSALIDGVCVEPEAGSIYPEYTEGPGTDSATTSPVMTSTGYPTTTTVILKAPVSSVTPPTVRDGQGGKVTEATERVEVTQAVTVPATPEQGVTSSPIPETTTKIVYEATTAIFRDVTSAVTMEATTAAVVETTTAAIIEATTAAIIEATTTAIMETTKAVINEVTKAAIIETTTAAIIEASTRKPEDVRTTPSSSNQSPATASTASNALEPSTDSPTTPVPTTAAATSYQTDSRTKEQTLTTTTPIRAPPPPPATETTSAQAGTSAAPSVGEQNSATEIPKPTTSKPLQTTEDYDHKDTIVLA